MERGKQASAMGGRRVSEFRRLPTTQGGQIQAAHLPYPCHQPVSHKPASLAYSSRKVFAGSIPAIREVGTAVATSVTHARVRTTAAIVGTS
jgi:hypothetical protein